ncbi:MAG: DUF262 domain-containing protein [Roseburia sp.]|nr:DUF262 domain-containing protein [Roseburia sp.]
MAKPRKQTYTMDMYLRKMKDKDIRNDAEVQRLFVWTNEQVNELLYTVLNDDYVPPIILGEEANTQLWITDGGQRSAAFMKFKYGNYKITKSIEASFIHYRTKVRDENGNIAVDRNGNIIWADVEFDIKNRTYDEFPEELKKKFNEYQIETVIHENCDMKRISELIKRYNNHTSMNTSQKAFTYIDNYAREVRNILDSSFFMNCGSYTSGERDKGILERVVLESVMCMFHLEDWKKEAKQIAKYLNSNSSKEEFEKLRSNIERLSKVMTEDVSKLFDAKDTFLWFALYERFLRNGWEDTRFIAFLREFSVSGDLRKKEVNGMTYEDLCINKKTGRTRSTKDKYIIAPKLDLLETLMREYIQGEENFGEETDTEKFIVDNVGIDALALHEDMDFYRENLKDLEEKAIKIESRLREEENQLSLLAMVVYSYQNDVDLDEWLMDYAKKNHMYFTDQKKNYLHMVNSLRKFQAER